MKYFYRLYQHDRYVADCCNAKTIARRVGCAIKVVYRSSKTGEEMEDGYTAERMKNDGDVEERLCICSSCGVIFADKSIKRFCPDCILLRSNTGWHENDISTKEIKRHPKRPGKPIEQRSPLSRIAAEASAHNMSYGKYVGIKGL